MKKLLTILLSAASLTGVLALTSCGGASGAKTYELALVTDVGDIDDESFNQTSWEAVRDYAKENKISYSYYRPTEDSTAARVTSIKQAIQKGAKVVVCPGFLFETAIYEVQDQYPNVKFVLLDGEPHTADYKTYKTSANVSNMLYHEEIAGYLAGYAAVMDGYTKLGFCGGMAVPAVQRYGSGYVQGIDAAAQAKGVSAEVNYYYANAFQATPEATAAVDGWYKGGTEVVFACGGKVYQSVAEGCKGEGKKWIGVDVDQTSVDPDKVLTSAMKDLRTSVMSALSVYYANEWETIGGKTWNLGLDTKLGNAEAKDYVGIPTANWKFTSFTKDQYSTLLSGIKAGSLTIDSSVSAAPAVSSSTTVTYVSAFAGNN